MERIKKIKVKNALYAIVGSGIVILGILIIWISTLSLPDFNSFTERKIASSTKIYDRTGTIVLYDLNDNIRRTVIPDEAIGANLKNATVAIEDSDFYYHNGISFRGLARAIWHKFIYGGKMEGGSTLTQQLIKNTLLTNERTITRKIKEWILAIKLEKTLSKDQILSLYLNEAPYGGTIYGIQEASKTFLGKDPIDLTLAEAAYLAAIPNSPTYYSPYRSHKDKLDERKNVVLKRMYDLKFITQDEYNKAKSEVVTFLPEQPTHIAAPHFVFFVKQYLLEQYGEIALEEGGLKVITTLDYPLEKKAEEIVKENALLNEKSSGGKNASAVAINAKTGEILAMVGSRDYFDKDIEGNFNVATASRQPGSSFKPFVYAEAFNKGYTADTVLFDVPTQFSDSCDAYGNPINGNDKKECYMPGNYDDSFRGPMSLRDALAQSINVVAVKLLYLVGIEDSLNLARSLGLTTLNDPRRYGLSLVIGGGEVTLLDMTSAYGVFATEGIRHPYKSIISVSDKNGNVLEKLEDSPSEILPVNTTRIISDILSDNVARTPTFGANSSLVIKGTDVAVKTGTTNSNKDAWTIGYSSSVVVGAWAGNNDNTPMKKGGAALAGPIWNGIMNEALKTYPGTPFIKPDPIDPTLPAILRGKWQGGDTFTIDKTSGGLATDFTPTENLEEKSITNIHTILYWIDKNNPTGGRPANPESDPQYYRWETAVQDWWMKNHTSYKTVTQAPLGYDTLHTASYKPNISISGINPGIIYKKDEPIKIDIGVQSTYPLKKTDIFMNNSLVSSFYNKATQITLTPKNYPLYASNNTLTIISYDNYGNTGNLKTIIEIE
jgi:penicillin-binding protein 1C